MDDFEFDNRLFYKFNSYNVSKIGNFYKNYWLSIETDVSPNEIRKVAFYYDLYFPNELKERKNINIFNSNSEQLFNDLYNYFNPWISNYRSYELYKFYYCFNNHFDDEIYNKLIDAISKQDYDAFHKNIPAKNLIEIYKLLLIFYPNFLGKLGNLFYNIYAKYSFKPYFTNWGSPNNNLYSIYGIHNFFFRNNFKLSKIERQNIFEIFITHKNKIKNIYEIVNGIKLNDIFSKNVFQYLLYNSCKHSNFWYDISSSDFEALIDLYSLFYDYKVEVLPVGFSKLRREQTQIFFCKYKDDIKNSISFLSDIKNEKLFNDFKNDHTKINDVNFLYTVGFYYNLMFPYDDINTILSFTNFNVAKIINFFNNKQFKDKFVDKIEKIKKITFSKDFFTDYFKIDKDTVKIDNKLITTDVLDYIMNAYDIFFPNEILPVNMFNNDEKLKFLKDKLENVIKLYYICNNKKEDFVKDKYFTKQFYKNFMIMSCTYGENGWWKIDKKEFKNIKECYSYLKIDKYTDIANFNDELCYKYFISHKDKLYDLINKIDEIYKIKFNFATATELINSNRYLVIDTLTFNPDEIANIEYLMNIVRDLYDDNKVDFIIEEKNNNGRKYYIYKIKEENYKHIKNLFDDKQLKDNFNICKKQIFKNFLDTPKDLKYNNISQDILIYIAKKYDKMFPNELDENYLIKKHKFLLFFEKTKPYPLLDYLIKFFAKNTMKFKQLYEKLNNIAPEKQSGSKKQKQAQATGQQAPATGQQAQGNVQKFVADMTAIMNDATKISNIVRNIKIIIAHLERAKNDAIRDINANKDNITANQFYDSPILTRLQSNIYDFTNNKNITDVIVKQFINDCFIDSTQAIYRTDKINAKYLQTLYQLYEFLSSQSFNKNQFFNKYSKIIFSTKQNTITNDEKDLIRALLMIYANLQFININKNDDVYYIDKTMKINVPKQIGNFLIFEPKFTQNITPQDYQDQFLKFIDFFKDVFFIIVFDYNNSISTKHGNKQQNNIINRGLPIK
jgi:hypothetical protein